MLRLKDRAGTARAGLPPPPTSILPLSPKTMPTAPHISPCKRTWGVRRSTGRVAAWPEMDITFFSPTTASSAFCTQASASTHVCLANAYPAAASYTDWDRAPAGDAPSAHFTFLLGSDAQDVQHRLQNPPLSSHLVGNPVSQLTTAQHPTHALRGDEGPGRVKPYKGRAYLPGLAHDPGPMIQGRPEGAAMPASVGCEPMPCP